MKKLLSTIVLMLLPLLANADAVEIGGIYYNLVNKLKSAEVTENPNKYSGSVVIPEKVEYEGTKYTVTSIENHAFELCRNLTSITIPTSVTSIGHYAFLGCSGLTLITIPTTVTSIGDFAFQGCRNLTSITIPNSVTNIGHRAFWDCIGLTSITILCSVTSIGGNAFDGCTGLTSVHISDMEAWCKIAFNGSASNPLSYAHHLFLNGEEVKDLVIPNTVTSIGYAAFSGCTGLTSITIPNSVTRIGDYAFSHCSSLTSITIPGSVTSIEGSAFKGCSGLTSITIPTSVTSIGYAAFSGCTGLTSITIPNSVTSIEGLTFDSCTGLTSISIPNSVTSIGSSTFRGCTSLTSITIPNNVTSIGNDALFGCTALIFVTIGSGIKSIDTEAFASCPELTDVYCYAEAVPSTNTDAFKDSYTEYATLHVPTASINNYKSTAPWSAFKTIVGLDGTTPGEQETPKCEKPTISYRNGKLSFSCATEGVDFISEITDTDIKKNYTKDVDLTVTYLVSVYATKSGYDNSDVATATLCWIDVDPKTEGITNGVANVRAQAVMIQNNDNVLTITGAPEGSMINVYDLSGKMAGSAKANPESTSIPTSLRSGEIGIVKIGDKSVKVLIK